MTNALLIRRRGMMGARQGGLPYDAEIEYLEGTGTQYIDTGIYINVNLSNFELGFKAEGDGRWGWVHQNNIGGTWLGSRNTANFKFWYRNYNSSITLTPLINSYELNLVKNRIIIGGITYSIYVQEGTDSIMQNSVKFFLWYDFSTSAIEQTSGITEKFMSFYIKINGDFVIDLIPVRVGTIGYMYDRVSGQLFGNAGTGDFILGPDIQ